jgi:hypothetical protein
MGWPWYTNILHTIILAITKCLCYYTGHFMGKNQGTSACTPLSQLWAENSCDRHHRNYTINTLAQITEDLAEIKSVFGTSWGTQWHSWMRYCAISCKVAGSIPDDVIEIFHLHNPFSCIMAMGLVQPLTEMSTMNISWEVKAAGAWADNLTNFMCRMSSN